MINNSISFGHKIPIVSCQVQKKRTGDFVKATVYEYDCQSKSDIDEVSSIEGLNFYKYFIERHMINKYEYGKFGHDNDKRFFVIQENGGEIIGLSQTNDVGENLNISYIETLRNKKYRFAGQWLIAAIASEVLASGGNRLFVKCPVDTALDFYYHDCKFKSNEDNELYMNKKQIKKFIKRTEQRTNSSVHNLNVQI